MTRDLRLTFVVESGTDVRLIQGLDRHFQLDLVCRKIPDGFHINWQPEHPIDVSIGPPSRPAFAAFLTRELLGRKPRPDILVVQGYATAALVTNIVGRAIGSTVVMLVCSPVEHYYLCRKDDLNGPPFRMFEFYGLKTLARLNALVGSNYVVLSQYLRRVVMGHGARGSIEVIPVYGVDLKRFRPGGHGKAAARAELGLPAAGKVVFFSSRIAPEKDADTVLRAIGQVNAAQERRVWLVNRSGGHESFMRRAAELACGEQPSSASRNTSSRVGQWTREPSFRLFTMLRTSAFRQAGTKAWASPHSRPWRARSR
jgi:glycosyltransferase involved in cell wall biosynthesis